MALKELQTSVVFEEAVSRVRDYARRNPNATKAAVHYSTDSFGIPEITVYTDDGHGNGKMLFRFPLI